MFGVIRSVGTARQFDCGQKDHTERCLTKGPFDCRLPGTDASFRIGSAEDAEAMIAKVRAKYLPHADDIEAIFAVGMCPMGLLTPFVLRLWLLYQRETSGHVMPWGYWETPEVYTEARAVIAMEQNAIQNEKDVGPSDGS